MIRDRKNLINYKTYINTRQFGVKSCLSAQTKNSIFKNRPKTINHNRNIQRIKNKFCKLNKLNERNFGWNVLAYKSLWTRVHYKYTKFKGCRLCAESTKNASLTLSSANLLRRSVCRSLALSLVVCACIDISSPSAKVFCIKIQCTH